MTSINFCKFWVSIAVIRLLYGGFEFKKIFILSLLILDVKSNFNRSIILYESALILLLISLERSYFFWLSIISALLSVWSNNCFIWKKLFLSFKVYWLRFLLIWEFALRLFIFLFIKLIVSYSDEPPIVSDIPLNYLLGIFCFLSSIFYYSKENV